MKKYNLIVVGGGISGVAAAVSAARDGLSVLLVEGSGNLGGAMSNSLVYPFMGFSLDDENDNVVKLLSAGIFTEMRERHKKYSVDGNDNYEWYKMVFDDMITEAGVDVLFHSTVFDVKKNDDKITGVSIASKSGVLEIEADFFVDATGDGDVIALAGCEFVNGRESDGLSQPMTTCFRMVNVDIPLFVKELPMIQAKFKELRENGTIKNPRENLLLFDLICEGVLHFNSTRVVGKNPVDAFEKSKAEIEARRQIYEIFWFLRKYSKAFTKSDVISIANHIGVRESRKLQGVHVITAEELLNCVDFEDSIALGNYCIDIHNPSGSGTTIKHIPKDKYYKIPYRALLPKEYTNLLVAGRCVSSTHEAHSAIRILPICACMGEAAGTAVALAHNTNTNAHTVDVKKLQESLVNKGAAL